MDNGLIYNYLQKMISPQYSKLHFTFSFSVVIFLNLIKLNMKGGDNNLKNPGGGVSKEKK